MTAAFRTLSLLVSVALLGFCHACAVAQTTETPQWRWSGVDRVVAISDVHGAFDAMQRTLRAASVIDGDSRWSGGGTHLVVTGDLLDRGPDSRPVMDLLMRLEGEAVAAGGRVHVLLGNHEVMNLVGDLRYVARGEYAAFADEDSPETRARVRDAWLARSATATGDEEKPAPDAAEFDKLAPEGFFGHREAFASDGTYGQWLLTKPLVIVINDTAFVHGGLPPMVADEGLRGVNVDLAADVERYVLLMERLVDAGLLLPTDNFYDHPRLLAASEEQPTANTAGSPQREDVGEAAQALKRLNESPVHDPRGPLWYRGGVACSPLIENDKLDAALEAIGARRVVIGHTPTPNREITQRLGGRVIEIDTGMLNGYYGGSGNALIIEEGRISVVDEGGAAQDAPLEHPRGADDTAAMSLERLLGLLENGQIRQVTREGDRTVVRIEEGEAAIRAVFRRNPRGFVPELAAFRLDRLLGLDMVPATVAREVEGRKGTLQYLPEPAVDERERAMRRAGGDAWCAVQDQWQAMYLFDALIHNRGRSPESMLYDPRDWQLMLVDHDDSFERKDDRPAYLKDIELVVAPAWRDALSSLSDERLDAELGDVLDERRLRALGNRRDMLLEAAL